MNEIVFCITCKGRTQHVEQTLPKNLTDNSRYGKCRFVLLDYNSPDHLLDYLKKSHGPSIKEGRLAVYSSKEPGPFRMAHAKNVAHRLGMIEGADVLVNLDADNFTGPDFADYINDQFQSAGGDIFLWSRMIQSGENRTPRGISGRIVVTRSAFLNAGGYDEKFSTWSPDDKDFNFRLRRLGYSACEIDYRYLDAVLHNDKMRFREYQHARTAQSEDQIESVVESDNTVVNYGKIGNAIVYKNFSENPIVLGDMPTRIFGIGMHKTATTSLHHALQILGYDSAHWKSAHWAKAIWEEMNTWGRSRTLEKHYALMDLPIPLLYQQLDKAYPGSKFILTTRNESSWIRSVQNHWDPTKNRFRDGWNTDPFTHKIHRALYGQRGFDEEIFLARYRRHNAEVLEYFKDRRKDLLVMDMDRGAGWAELCGFLGHPIPAEKYPWEFVTGRGDKP